MNGFLVAVLSLMAVALVIGVPLIHITRSSERFRERHERWQRIQAIEDAARRTQEREEAEERATRAKQRAVKEELERRFIELVSYYDIRGHYEDARYLTALAHRDKDKFIAHKNQILADYVALQTDQALATLLWSRRPDIVRCIASGVELLQIAETIDVLGQPPNLDRYEHFAMCEDAAFINEYARTHTDELLDQGEEIFAAFDRLHQHPQFVDQLKRDRPYIYRRALWRVHAYGLALRLSARAREPRRRRTAVEVRAAKVRLMEARATDGIELINGRLDKIEELQRRLEERPEIDPDTREMLVRQFVESLEEELTLPGKVYS